MLIKLVFMQPPQRLKTLTAVAQEKKFPIVLLLVSLPGCYAGTQHQQRRAAFFGKTNGEKLSINNAKTYSLQEVKDSYEAAGLEDFELFWDNKPVSTMNKLGLLKL